MLLTAGAIRIGTHKCPALELQISIFIDISNDSIGRVPKDEDLICEGERIIWVVWVVFGKSTLDYHIPG